MYTININYQTGSSFHTEDCEEKIGCCWESKDLARKALKAIREHYKVFNSRGFRDNRTEKDKNKEASKFDWYDEEYPEYNLQLEVDSGEKVRISAFWIGYFEK